MPDPSPLDTAAISDRDRQRAAGVVEDRRIQTTCSYCGVGCQLEVHAAGDLILRIEGARSPVNNEHLCVKGRYAHTFVQHGGPHGDRRGPPGPGPKPDAPGPKPEGPGPKPEGPPHPKLIEKAGPPPAVEAPKPSTPPST